MRIEQPLIVRDFRSGMNNSVSNYLQPDYVLRQCLNAYTDESNGNELGNVKQLPGYVIIGSAIQSGKNILGLHSFINASETTDRLIAVVNDSGDTESRTYYRNAAGGSWDEIGPAPVNWTASTKMRFETFLDYVYATNGTDDIKSWTGNTSHNWGTTNLTNAPNGSLIINYSDRLLISGNSTYRSRIYKSGFPASDYTISWDNGTEANRDYIDINPDDNDHITGWINMGNLAIFKNRSLYTWNGQSTQGDKVIDVGAPVQEAIKMIQGQVVFFGESKNGAGIFLYAGAYPQKISFPVQKWIDAVATTSYGNVGAWSDNDNYYLSLGDITVEGVAYSNAGIRYNVPNQTFSTFSFPDQMLIGTERAQTDGTRSVIVGDTDGSVYTWGSGTDFNGSAINVQLKTKQLEFGSRLRIKRIRGFAAYSTNPQSAVVQVSIDGGQWETLGKLTKKVQNIDCDIHGHYFEFRVLVANTNEPFIFDGFEFYNIDIENYPK